jgi:hypothetical protein
VMRHGLPRYLAAQNLTCFPVSFFRNLWPGRLRKT